MAAARAVGADRVELYTEPYAARARHAGAGARSWQRFAAAAQAAQAQGLGVNAGHDLNRANLADFLRARARRAGGVDRPRADRRCARARPGRDRARLPALHPPRDRGRRAMIYGIGTDICDIRRIAATLAAARRPLRRARARPARDSRSSARAARACRSARPALPGHALLGQGGVLQGDRPGHAHADDLARLRDRQRRRAASPTIRLHGALAALVRGARACAPTSASPTRATTPPASSSSKPRGPAA